MQRPFELVLIEHGAPTLAAIKPANLFRVEAASRAEVLRSTKKWAAEFAPYGIRICILKECMRSGSFLIYLYREQWLTALLQEPTCQAFLQKVGYREPHQLQSLLAQLSQRLCMESEFPHEIGVFLGYPLCDVVGFIENKGLNFTCSGYWKSYSDPQQAQKCFEQYKKCTAIYKQRFAEGTPLMDLVVAA